MLSEFYQIQSLMFGGDRRIFRIRHAPTRTEEDVNRFDDNLRSQTMTHSHILFKNRNVRFPVSFRASTVVGRCISTRRGQTPCSTPHHTVPRQQHRPHSPVPSLSPDQFKPNRTHLERVGQTRSRQSDRPCNRPNCLLPSLSPISLNPIEHIRNELDRLVRGRMNAPAIVTIFPCPPCLQISLNPIEHIWNELDGRVRGRLNAPAIVTILSCLPCPLSV